MKLFSLRSLREYEGALLFLILLGFLGLVRYWQAHQGLPYLFHYDEPFIVNYALKVIREGEFNPGRFHYGTASIYSSAVALAGSFLYMCSLPPAHPEALQRLEEMRTFVDGTAWSFSHPTGYVWARMFIGLCGVGIAAALGGLARWWLGWPAALLAVTAYGLAPVSVLYATCVTVDVPSGFFVMLAIVASVGYIVTGSGPALFAASASVGGAIAFKPNAGVWLLLLAIAIAERGWRTGELPRWWVWPALLCAPPVVFLALTPYAILDLPTYLQDIGSEVRHYGVLGHGIYTVEPGLANMWRQVEFFLYRWTLPALVAGLAGWWWLIRRKGAPSIAISAAIAFLALTQSRIDFERNFLFLYPLLALGIGASALQLAKLIRGEQEPWKRGGAGAALAVVVFGVGYSAAQATAIAYAHYTTPETRSLGAVRAAAFARSKRALLGIDAALRMHPLDKQRLDRAFREEPLQVLLAEMPPGSVILCAQEYTVRDPTSPLAADAEGLSRVAQGLTPFHTIEGDGPLILDANGVDPTLILVQVPPKDSPGP